MTMLSGWAFSVAFSANFLADFSITALKKQTASKKQAVRARPVWHQYCSFIN